MKKNVLFVLSLIFFSFVSTFARAQENAGTIGKVTVVHINVPKVYEPGGKGLYPDILREATQGSGAELTFNIAPSYARVMREANVEKKVDVLVGIYKREIAEYDQGVDGKRPMTCSTLHHDADQVVAVFPKGKVPADWKGKESLLGKTLAWTNEYIYDVYLFDSQLQKSGGSFQEFDNIEQGLKMVEAGRIYTYLIPYQEFVETTLKDKFEYRDVQKLPLHYCFTKDAKGFALKKAYEEGMTKMMKNNRLKELFHKWYTNGYYPY